MVWKSKAGEERSCEVRTGVAGNGEAGVGRRGAAGIDEVRQARRGWSGQESRGGDWKGRDWQARKGRRGEEGRAGRGRQARIRLTYSFTIFLMHNYVYKKTAFTSKEVKAQTVGEQLEAIQQENGKVTAQLVIDQAKPIGSPLHPIFQWDDEQAAEQYRLHQARNLIRSIEVVKPEGTNEPVYVHVKAVEAYLPIRTVVTNTDFYESAKDSAEKRLAEAVFSLSQLKEIAKESQQQSANEALQFALKAQEQLAKS